MPDLEAVGDGRTHEANCLNCGAALAGNYCHECGQKAHVHRTIAAWWHDFLHSVLHLDGKFWRTLPLLAWRPGELTRRYIEGERAKFVSPIAIFLFSAFLMLAAFTLLGGPMAMRSSPDQARPLETDSGASADGTAREIAGGTTEGGRNVRLTVRPTGVGWLDRAIGQAQENPELLGYKLQNNAYKFSWALIPISTPFVWLLFLHRRRYRRFGPYDHVVFVTYSIAFMSLALVALSLLRIIGLPEDLAALAMLIVPPLHVYRQLKGAYGLGRGSALWRTIALMGFALVVLMLFLALLLALGALG